MANDLRRMDLAVERPEISHLAVDTHDELALATERHVVVETSVDLAVEQARVADNQARPSSTWAAATRTCCAG